MRKTSNLMNDLIDTSLRNYDVRYPQGQFPRNALMEALEQNATSDLIDTLELAELRAIVREFTGVQHPADVMIYTKSGDELQWTPHRWQPFRWDRLRQEEINRVGTGAAPPTEFFVWQDSLCINTSDGKMAVSKLSGTED